MRAHHEIGSSRDVDFEAFFEQVEPRLRRALVAHLGPERGREAAAEALVWSFENWARVRNIENQVGYLYRVGISRTRPRLAGLARIDRSQASTEDATIAELELWRVLRRLPRRQRVAVVLVCAYGWKLSEVAETTNVSTSTVNTHVRRGLARLRRELGAKPYHEQFLA